MWMFRKSFGECHRVFLCAFEPQSERSDAANREKGFESTRSCPCKLPRVSQCGKQFCIAYCDNTPEQVRMSANELGCRLNGHIRAERQWTLIERGCERVVHT